MKTTCEVINFLHELSLFSIVRKHMHFVVLIELHYLKNHIINKL
jgi:hypothetical protein